MEHCGQSGAARGPWALLLLLLASHGATARRPVILVPGVHGCVYRVRLTQAFSAPNRGCTGPRDWRKPSPLNLINPSFKNCQAAQLNVTFDEELQRWSNASGAELDWNVDFGGVEGIAALDQRARHVTSWFQAMVNKLKGAGYSTGVDLHGAPYDWRLAPDGWSQPGEFYDRLRALVERTVAANGEPAHLVSHSLGGSAVLGFLARVSEAWKRRHVASFVPIVPNFGGAVTNVMTFVYGFPPGLPVPHDYLRPLYTSLPSGVLQLPTPAAYAGGPPLVVTAGRNYTAADVPALLGDLGLAQAQLALQRLTDGRQRADLLPPPGVPVLLLTASGIRTPRTITFNGTLAPDHGLKPIAVEYGDGDGVVNSESALWAKAAWRAAHKDFRGVDHYGALWSGRVLRAVQRHVLGSPDAAAAA